MEGLLICIGKRTKMPFFIYETKTNIYSVEELCYYIYNNIETLDEKIFDAHLIAFFKRCEREDLAEYLEKALLTKGISMEEIIRNIMTRINYYNRGDIEKLSKKIKQLATRPVEDRLKAMGDSLLKAKKYALAEKKYKKLLDMGVEEYMPAEFCGKLWYNLGVIYARLLYMKLARECFQTAYNIYPNEMTKKTLALTAKLNNDETYIGLVKDDDKASAWEEEWSLKEEMVNKELRENGEANACVELYEAGEVAKYQEGVSRLIGKWKQEYREQTK